MTRWQWVGLCLWLALTLLAAGALGCAGDDDDDNDDSGGDDDNDNDADDDDDSTPDHPCEDLYDVIIDGETDMGANTTTWTARLTIADDGTIAGLLTPGEAEPEPYTITGFRNDETTGYLDGSFPRPSTIPDAICGESTIYNHIDFTVIDGIVAGDVTFYCGEVSEDTIIGTVNEATGEVSCGDFTA